MKIELSPVETRILGALLEKERITPENYPISLNSLLAACNQTTSRDPVVAFDVKTVEAGLQSLRDKGLATVIFGAGSRVQKYRHNLADHLNLERREVAILTVLMLRGPQTPGELRSRTERLYTFGGVEEVDACLERLGTGETPLARILPARPGQKERRHVQLLSGEPPAEESPVVVPVPSAVPETVLRLESLEKEVAALKSEIQQMREEFISKPVAAASSNAGTRIPAPNPPHESPPPDDP